MIKYLYRGSSFRGQSYKQQYLIINSDTRVVIYNRRVFIRLTTAHMNIELSHR